MSAPTTARLIPRYPDDWRALVSGPRWGRRVAAVLFAAVGVMAMWGVAQISRLSRETDSGADSGAMFMAGFGVMLVVLAFLHWPFPPGRALPRVVFEDDGTPVVVFGRQLGRALAVAVPCALGLLLALRAVVDLQDTIRRGWIAVSLVGLLLALALWFLWRRINAPRQFSFEVSRRGIKPPLGEVIAWEKVLRVDASRARALEGPRYPGYRVASIEIHAPEPVIIKCHDHATHPVLLLNLITWCCEHPELREQLGSAEALDLLGQLNTWAAERDRLPDNPSGRADV